MGKAKTKSAKIRQKRGRPRIEGVARTPSGQRSRAFDVQKAENRLAYEAATWRRRMDNPTLSPEEARKQEHGSIIHQWHEQSVRVAKRKPDGQHPNQFTAAHRQAAEDYHQLYLDWLAVIEAKRQRSASDFTGPGGYNGADPFDEDRAAHHASIEERFKAARRAILESGPFGMMAVETIIIENQPAESLRGDLRIALNRLATLFKLQDVARAA